MTTEQIEQKEKSLLAERDRLVKLVELQQEIQGLEAQLLGIPGCEGPRINSVTSEVAAHFQIPYGHLKMRNRTARLAWARFYCFKLMRERLNMTLVDIGNYFKLDHGAIHSGIKRLTGRIDVEPKTAKAFREVEARVCARILKLDKEP